MLSALVAACGGNSVNRGSEPELALPSLPAAGTPNASPGSAGSPPIGNVDPLPHGGNSNDVACNATLQEASNAFGIPCPGGVCAATAWGQTCDALPVSVLNTTESTSVTATKLRTITINISATQGKACHYEIPYWLNGGDGPRLTGAEAWGDTNEFCGGKSKRIAAGTLPPDGTSSPPRLLCEGGAQSTEPPRGCFGPFFGICGSCCPAEPPDCSGKPDGYPGYTCIPADNAFAACSCWQGSWECVIS